MVWKVDPSGRAYPDKPPAEAPRQPHPPLRSEPSIGKVLKRLAEPEHRYTVLFTCVGIAGAFALSPVGTIRRFLLLLLAFAGFAIGAIVDECRQQGPPSWWRRRR
jgi:hypothetical protein